jgi:hypothetical protein
VITLFISTVLAASLTCVPQANATGALALVSWEKRNYAYAAKLETQAALGLERCLTEHPSEVNGSSRQRVGELWMYAGVYASDDADWQSAWVFLTHAKQIFSDLRSHGLLHGASLDEVLLDAHTTDRDLVKVKERQKI